MACGLLNWAVMKPNDLASTPAPATTGLGRKRRGDAPLLRAARLRAAALCALLGVTLLAAGSPESLWGVASAVIPALRPDTPNLPAEVQLRIGDAEFARGHYEEALHRYALVVTQHPTHALAERATWQQIQTHIALGDVDAAQSVLQSFRMRAPRHASLPRLLLDVALLQFRGAQYERAARNYTDVVALMTRFERDEASQLENGPATPAERRAEHNEKLRRIAERREIERTARFNLALCYDMEGKDEGALSAYKRFARRFPRDVRSPEAYYRAGILEQRAERLDAALQSFALVWQAPQVPATFRAAGIYQAGRCLERQRRYDEARDIYRLALDLEHVGDAHRLAALSRYAFLLRDSEPLRAMEIYRELADDRTDSVYRALARQHLLDLEQASAMASAR